MCIDETTETKTGFLWNVQSLYTSNWHAIILLLSKTLFLRACLCICMFSFLFFSFLFFFILLLITFVRSNRNTSYQTTEWFPIDLDNYVCTLAVAEFSPRSKNFEPWRTFCQPFSTRKCWSSFAKLRDASTERRFQHDSIIDLPPSQTNHPLFHSVHGSALVPRKETRSQSGGNLTFTRKRQRRVSLWLSSHSSDSFNFVNWRRDFTAWTRVRFLSPSSRLCFFFFWFILNQFLLFNLEFYRGGYF